MGYGVMRGIGCGDLEIRTWAPSVGPKPWDPYVLTIHPICALKGP